MPFKPLEEGYLFIYRNSSMRYKFRPVHMAFWRERFLKLAEPVPPSSPLYYFHMFHSQLATIVLGALILLILVILVILIVLNCRRPEPDEFRHDIRLAAPGAAPESAFQTAFKDAFASRTGPVSDPLELPPFSDQLAMHVRYNRGAMELPNPAFLNTKYPWYAKKYRPACMHTVDIEFLYPNFTDFNEDCLYLNIFYPNLPNPAFLNTKYPWYAKKYRPACMHTVDIEFLYPNFTDFNEDCLYLNIFYPNFETFPQSTQEEPKSGYPVLFHVHGGSFVGGSSHMYPGHLLASKGLVVVTFNYRLGPFGFLSTGDSASVGNYGLWDQLFALRWVKENIEWFRGDPSQITLMGESAGGASVGLLTVSPRSRDQDLFHRAIIMSGSDLSPWAMSDPNAINTGHYAIELGRRLGCPATRGLALSLSQMSSLGESWKPVRIRPGEFGHSSVNLRQSVPYYAQVDTDALVDCLRHSYSAQEIVDVSKSLDPFRGATSFIWTPVVDGPTGFLPRMPLEERKLGHFSKIPLLAGLVHDESSFPFMGKLE
ncbi:neuroligin, partial [Paragonimus westermani]